MSNELQDLVRRALSEDCGPGDVTAEAVVPETSVAHARIVQKAQGVLFGFEVAAEVFAQAGAAFEPLVAEGEWHDSLPLEIATIDGPSRGVLAAERTALNFLAHLSGIATMTAQFVRAAAPGGAQILDTRKTTPGLRKLEKAAVAAGGGRNHRMGLYDAILIKENHAELAGGVGAAVAKARAAHPEMHVEIEVRDAAEVQAGLEAQADRLLLDNMGISGLRSAVAARDAAVASGKPRAELEASGGVSLTTVPEISATGVDFISVGAVTHSAPALDLSLLLD